MNATDRQTGDPRQGHCEQDSLRMSLGAYVLHALDEVESQQVRRHLRECVPCQEEYAELVEVRVVLDHARATAGLDARSSLDSTPSLAARPTGRAPNRRRRRLGLAAAGAVLASTAGIGGFLLGGNHSGTPPGTRAVAASGLYGISTSIRFHPEAWGTSIQVTMNNVPADYTCTLTAVGKDGRVEAAATWSSGPRGGTVTVPAAVAIPASSIDHFDVAVAPGIDLIVPAG